MAAVKWAKIDEPRSIAERMQLLWVGLLVLCIKGVQDGFIESRHEDMPVRPQSEALEPSGLGELRDEVDVFDVHHVVDTRSGRML
ncbi:hypothetical protein VP1G_10831 [Cytospora mali]|uniref:Uncharacterized protein n=1 Tax=Cytospora mali TaxID=578113 RepID=A0A194UYA7_CYTMA|nr:hypothetical protein VP1G_10831 [Valsa mali var. pyri (nom. inval.)]